MKSITIQLECQGQPVTFTVSKDGSLEIDGFHPEDAEIAREMGFEVDACWYAYDLLSSAIEAGDNMASEASFQLRYLLSRDGYFDDAGMHESRRIQEELIDARMVAALLLLGAKADYYNDTGEFFAEVAAKKGWAQAIEDLIEGGARMKWSDDSALALAAGYDYPEVIEVLAEHGYDVTEDNNLALIKAAQQGSADSVALLLELGADPLEKKTRYPGSEEAYTEESAYDWARYAVRGRNCRNDNKEVLRLIEDHLMSIGRISR